MQVKPFPDMGYLSDNEDGTAIGKQLSQCGLYMEYMTPRPFKDGDVICDPERRSFKIRGSRKPLSSVESRNIVLRRQTSLAFSYSVSMDISDMTEGQSAGITGYYDENTFFEFGVIKRDGSLYVYSNEHIGAEDLFLLSKDKLAGDARSIRLFMDTDNLKRRLTYSINDGDPRLEHTTLQNVFYLCDEGLSMGKRFTGALVGMYVYEGDKNLTVTFRDDRYNDI